MRTDSLFFNANETKLALGVAGIKVKLEKKNDSLWTPRGIIGFDRLLVRAPEFGLPLRVRKTAVTVDGTENNIKKCLFENRAFRYGCYRGGNRIISCDG